MQSTARETQSGNRQARSSRALRERLVGRTIRGVIARPGREGQPPVVLMLELDDGSVVEFVSPRSDRLLRAALGAGGRAGPTTGPDQLALAVV